MEEFKGTPGPWYPVNYGGWIHIQSTNFYENTDILNEEYCLHAEANAQLAATAPDLLEACMTVVSGYEGDGMEKMGIRDEVFYRHCKSAINKALGK